MRHLRLAFPEDPPPRPITGQLGPPGAQAEVKFLSINGEWAAFERVVRLDNPYTAHDCKYADPEIDLGHGLEWGTFHIPSRHTIEI